MAKHNPDTPNDAERDDAERRPSVEDGPVPDAHRGEPEPRPDTHTRAGADADMTRPDQQEVLGPVEGLFHASAVEAKGEVTDDPENEAEAERMGIEAEGVEAAQIFSLLLATVITLALAVVGVFFMVAYYSDAASVERSSGALYPEITENRNRATDLLTNYGRTDDVYRIPITEAMGLVAADYAGRGGEGLRPAPDNFRTVYHGSYFADAGISADTTTRPATDVPEQPQPVPGGTPDEAAASSDAPAQLPAPAGGTSGEPEDG